MDEDQAANVSNAEVAEVAEARDLSEVRRVLAATVAAEAAEAAKAAEANAPTAAPLQRDDNLWAMLAHLTAFIFPFLGPLLILILRGPQSRFVDAHAREALNMHVTLAIESVVAAILAVVTLGVGLLVIVPLAMLIGLAYTIFTIMATLKANEGQLYRYPAILRIF